MEHTKGPWIYEPTTKTIRSKPANYWLATMDSWDGAVDNEANAHLIAAAPELLEACRAVAANDDRQSDEDYLIHITVMDRIKAAITKAEGKKGERS